VGVGFVSQDLGLIDGHSGQSESFEDWGSVVMIHTNSLVNTPVQSVWKSIPKSVKLRRCPVTRDTTSTHDVSRFGLSERLIAHSVRLRLSMSLGQGREILLYKYSI
jgi:hypothetical protein